MEVPGGGHVNSSQRRWRVHSLWVGPPMGRMEWMCMTSFIRHGAEFHLFTDNLERKVPSGVVLHDSRSLIGEKPLRYGPRSGSAGSLAISGDAARMTWLYEHGGWWVDMDVVCLRSFEPIDHGMQVAWEDEPTDGSLSGCANVAVMRLPEKSRLARLLVRRLSRPWWGSPWESPGRRLRNFVHLRDTFLDPGNVEWGWSAGPHAVTAAINYLGLRDQVRSSRWFYPIHWKNWRAALELAEDEFAELATNSYTLHLWAEMFRGAGMDKDAAMQQCGWARTFLEDFPPQVSRP